MRQNYATFAVIVVTSATAAIALISMTDRGVSPQRGATAG